MPKPNNKDVPIWKSHTMQGCPIIARYQTFTNGDMFLQISSSFKTVLQIAPRSYPFLAEGGSPESDQTRRGIQLAVQSTPSQGMASTQLHCFSFWNIFPKCSLYHLWCLIVFECCFECCLNFKACHTMRIEVPARHFSVYTSDLIEWGQDYYSGQTVSSTSKNYLCAQFPDKTLVCLQGSPFWKPRILFHITFFEPYSTLSLMQLAEAYPQDICRWQTSVEQLLPVVVVLLLKDPKGNGPIA